MINEKKVIIMTKLASFEKHDSRKTMNIVNYYRSDYLGFQILKAIVAATISYLAVLVVYVFYNFESLMADIYKIDLMEMGKKLGIIYLMVVGIYSVLCYFVCAHRYKKAKKTLKQYYINLRELEKLTDR